MHVKNLHISNRFDAQLVEVDAVLALFDSGGKSLNDVTPGIEASARAALDPDHTRQTTSVLIPLDGSVCAFAATSLLVVQIGRHVVAPSLTTYLELADAAGIRSLLFALPSDLQIEDLTLDIAMLMRQELVTQQLETVVLSCKRIDELTHSLIEEARRHDGVRIDQQHIQ